MRAVGCSIRNRVDHPAWWGNDYGSVIGKKFQYSSMAAPGDPQLIRFPGAGDAEFAEALQIADALVNHEPIANPTPCADSFYDTSIPPPAWATPECYVGTVGRLRFYNVDHDYERVEVPAIVPVIPMASNTGDVFGAWWRRWKGIT